ncbi:MAG TPA: hypothetical protein VF580_03965 [Thermoanaerobaculia bacterium]
MSSTIHDLQAPHTAYTRLSDRFKSLWTFHQLLQAVHKGIPGGAPSYTVDFQGIYDQIRNVATVMSSVPPDQALDSIRLLDVHLDAVQQKLANDDARISPRHVRRFFERLQTEDEKVLLSVLRFYFTLRRLDGEALDKLDFLVTLVGARKAIDDGRSLVRFPQELQKMFGSFLALVKRPPVPEGMVRENVVALSSIRREIESCEKFEELVARQLLEKLRDAKRRLGPAVYSVDVLSAVLETNLAAKNKFRELYETEERRILESSRHLLEAEHNPRYRSLELQEEFRRFRLARDTFDQQLASEGVRHRSVQRLAEAIDDLTARLELPSKPGPAPPRAPEVETETDPLPDPAGVLDLLEGSGRNASLPGVLRDQLTAEESSKILFSVESMMGGTGSGTAASSKVLAPLRLEPWEVRAVRRILESNGSPAGEAPRDRLFLDAAALRLRIDEEARFLRDPRVDQEPKADMERRLSEAGRCLIRSQELDRTFRQELEEASGVEESERLNELHRSRFRLLRGFSGLWLLHNQLVQG